VRADPQVIAGARELTNKFLSDPASVNRTEANAALGVAATFGDAALFDRLTSLYENATIPALKASYLEALTLFRDPALIQRAGDYAFSGKVRSQDLPGYLAGLSFNQFARNQAWSLIKAHWGDLQRDVPTALGAFVAGVSTFCDAESKKDVQDFFATHPAGTASRSLQRSLESLDRCIAFRAAQQPSFEKAVASVK